MRAVKQLGWVVLGALVMTAGPMIANAKSKEVAADDSDLEGRVRALEKKVNADQQTDTTEHKSLGDRVSAVEGDLKATKDSIADKLGLTLHGFVAASYLYNFNSPDSRTNQIRVFDTEANTFTLDQATISISKKRESDNLGFVVNMDFGKEAEIVGGASRWSNNPNSSESNNSFELREAYITYKLPVGNVNLKAGRFVTLLGAEIIDNYDNHNFNVSRSFSFGYAIPFTHTGVLANIPVGDMVAIDVGAVNGWDDVVDRNDGKTLLAGIAINPADMLSIYISGTYGPEEENNGHSKRGVTTAVATLKATDALTLALEGTYGNESDIAGPDATKSADWYGTAGYIVFKADDALSFALRGEVFSDPDGVRTGVAEAGFGPGVTLWEFTPTVAYQITDGLLWRAEFRHDEGDKRAFQHDSNFVRGQDTISTQLIYSF